VKEIKKLDLKNVHSKVNSGLEGAVMVQRSSKTPKAKERPNAQQHNFRPTDEIV